MVADTPIFVISSMYYFNERYTLCNARFPAYVNTRLGCKAALGCTPRLCLSSLFFNYLRTPCHLKFNKSRIIIATIGAIIVTTKLAAQYPYSLYSMPYTTDESIIKKRATIGRA